MIFTIYTKPVGQMRARAAARGKFARVYKASAQEQREQTLSALLAPYVPETPLDGPLLLYVDAVLQCPAKPARIRQEALSGKMRPTKKPDADNLAKHLKDVMTQLQFWHDDAQVCDLVVRKWYGLKPCWRIRLEPAAVAPLGFPEEDAA